MQPGMMQDVEDAINAMDSVLEEILEEMDSGLQDADSGKPRNVVAEFDLYS